MIEEFGVIYPFSAKVANIDLLQKRAPKKLIGHFSLQTTLECGLKKLKLFESKTNNFTSFLKEGHIRIDNVRETRTNEPKITLPNLTLAVSTLVCT